MKVKEMIEKLSKFDNELEVIISDGYRQLFYNTNDLEIAIFTDENNKSFVDFGISVEDKE